MSATTRPSDRSTAPPVASGAASGASDDVVFTDLYPALWRFAAAAAGAGFDPDDLVQEAVARALRKGRLADLDNPGAYLRRTIVNLASNERRRRFRHDRAVVRTVVSEEQHDRYSSDVAILSRLRPQDRTLLWLTDVEGWDFGAAAEVLNCTPEAARARASRARLALRSHLKEQTRHD